MDISNMKNMIVLKNLPSNIVEEAIVIVKDNRKLKNYQLAENDNLKKMAQKDSKIEKNGKEKKMSTTKLSDKSKDYIIKEAEMLIANYITELEKKTPAWKNNMKKLEKKYRKSLQINVLLGFATVISLIVSLI